MTRSSRKACNSVEPTENVPEAQRAIQARCHHPSGQFTVFPKTALVASIPARFEEQVRLHPDRPALKTVNEELTYSQLNRAANRIAHSLVALPGEAADTVAVLVEPGVLQIAAVIAALKAGKIYVPLDPAYPLPRLRDLLSDSQTRIVLTSKRNRQLAAELAGQLPTLEVDMPQSGFSPKNLGLDIDPRKTAFILYTSGSTGKPKGCPQTHRNVLHDVRNYTNTGHFCPQDRFLLVSSLSFSDSVRTLYGALLNGALLCPFDIKAHGLEPLGAWLRDAGVTIYRSAATVYRHFVATLSSGTKFPTLRLIYLGAEPVYRKDFELYQTHFPDDCILVNRLGTSETLTFRWYFMDKNSEVENARVPVGYPVPDMKVVLLDPEPPETDGSQVGEIGVKSEYLPDGYWRNPDLTQSVFLEGDRGGPRTYRTGDIGRLQSDGCLVHLGRKDFQVKVRGHRIEPAEIELLLQEHHRVREAVVATHAHEGTDDRLVAYLTSRGLPLPTVSDLRSFLAKRIPAFMIPSEFVFLNALPLTVTGKVDRRALPASAPDRPGRTSAYAGPRNAIESKIAEIWSQILDLPAVGVHDAFLDVGGDSLKALQITSRVTKAYGLDLPVRLLLERPTIAEMAELIRLASPSTQVSAPD